DAAINEGNSGGPLIWAATKQVIGMNTLVNREAGSEGLGFSIASNTVRAIADEPTKNAKIGRGASGSGDNLPTPRRAAALALPALRRHDASLYILASGLGGLGLGIALFYLNFLYRALGFDARAIGVLGGAQALGALAGALPAAVLPRRMPRRNAIFIGGFVTALGVIGILTQSALPAMFVAAALTGCGGIIVASSGSALVADATTGLDRPRMFGQQVALGALA